MAVEFSKSDFEKDVIDSGRLAMVDFWSDG